MKKTRLLNFLFSIKPFYFFSIGLSLSLSIYLVSSIRNNFTDNFIIFYNFSNCAEGKKEKKFLTHGETRPILEEPWNLSDHCSHRGGEGGKEKVG